MDPLHSSLSQAVATGRDEARHTLTVKEASDLFAAANVPRSPRSIQRFCKNGNLDCVLINTEQSQTYLVAPESVEKYVRELQQLASLARSLETPAPEPVATERDLSRQDAPRRDMSRQEDEAPSSDRETSELRNRIDTLEKENVQLKINDRAKEQVIGMMIDERREFVAQIAEQSRVIGTLETRVAQLAPPRQEEVIVETATEPEPVSPTVVDLAPSEPEQPQRRSFFRRIFR